jgi:putative oxidoreductase
MSQSSGAVVTSDPTKAEKAANIALWVVQGLLALAFVGAASGKLLSKPDMVGLYEAIGVGQWFRYVTGVLELTGAALIVIPRTKFFGAALLSMIMVGATLTHVFILHNAPTAPLVLLLLSGIVAWARRESLQPVLSRLGLVRS